MRKLLLTLLMAGIAVGAVAQRDAAYGYNTFFFSVKAGGVFYKHSQETSFTFPSAGITFGRWLMRPLAFRLSGDVAMAPSHYQNGAQVNSPFLTASAEFMWDVNATFFSVHNTRFATPFPIYPLIGLGVAYRPELTVAGEDCPAEHDFQSMLGFQVPMRLGRRADAFFEYRCLFLPQGFDSSPNGNYMHTFGLGLNFRSADHPFGRRTTHESRNTSEDWFVGFGAGVQYSSYDFEEVVKLSSRLWTPTVEMQIGRNYSHVWTIRFELSGFLARERYRFDANPPRPGMWYTFNCLHTDFMANISHLFNFNRGVKWNLFTYAGAGPVWRYQNHPLFNLAADAGIMVRRYIDNAGDFYIDLKYIMVPPRIAGGVGPSGDLLGVGYASLTFGYLFNFGHSTTRYRMPVNSTIN